MQKKFIKPNWEARRGIIMKHLLAQKLIENPGLRQKLTATAPNQIIQQNYWHDNNWGQCFCKKHRNVQGENVLERLLMEIRTQFVKEDLILTAAIKHIIEL